MVVVETGVAAGNVMMALAERWTIMYVVQVMGTVKESAEFVMITAERPVIKTSVAAATTEEMATTTAELKQSTILHWIIK